MANSANKKAYNADYAASKLKRVPLDMQIAAYDKLKEIAAAADLPVNTYIKEAIAYNAAADGYTWSANPDK